MSLVFRQHFPQTLYLFISFLAFQPLKALLTPRVFIDTLRGGATTYLPIRSRRQHLSHSKSLGCILRRPSTTHRLNPAVSEMGRVPYGGTSCSRHQLYFRCSRCLATIKKSLKTQKTYKVEIRKINFISG